MRTSQFIDGMEQIERIESESGLFIEDIMVNYVFSFHEEFDDTLTGRVRPAGKYYAVQMRVLIPITKGEADAPVTKESGGCIK